METDVAALTVKDFCKAYSVGHSSAYLEMAAGRLPYRKHGRRTLIRKADADAWLNSLPKGNPDPKQPDA